MSIVRRSAVATISVALLLTACSAAPGGAGSKGKVFLGVDLPLQGSSLAATQPILNGFQLAVDEANAANATSGYAVELQIKDDAVQGNPDAQQGAQNAQSFVSNPDVVGMLGPYNSGIAKAQIPITNEGGLLQCSPSNTNEGLTKPEYGGADLRSAHPDRIAYVRVVTADDILAPAAARYAYNTLGKRKALVIDDTGDAADAADRFQKEFERLGGTVIREGLPATTSDYTPTLTAAQSQGVDVAYFAGVTATGGGLLRKQMGQVGMGDIPLLSGDGIQDGSASTEGSYNNIAGPAADHSFSTVAAITEIPDREAFVSRYRTKFNQDPGAYSATAYACAQIELEALRKATTDKAGLREAIRAYVTNPANSFDTVLGKVSFDENGDTTQRIISIFESKGGAWVYLVQESFE